MECEVHIASACGIFGCFTKVEEGAGLKAGPLTHTFLIYWRHFTDVSTIRLVCNVHIHIMTLV